MGKHVNGVELAEIFGVTSRTVQNWHADGMPCEVPGKRGTSHVYDTANVYQWLLQRASGSALDLTVERARLAKEQADKTALDNELRRGELVSVHDVLGLWAKLASETRTRVLSVPVKVAPLVIGLESMPEAKEIIETALHDALSSIATDRTGLPDGDQATAETGPKRVGGQLPETEQRGECRAGPLAD